MDKIKKIIYFRQQINFYLREFLFSKGYLEADVPVLSPSLIPESYLEPFQTEVRNLKGKKWPGYLTASPETYLKRLLVQGSGNVFYLGKAFRNAEPMGKIHNYEFTILEWYSISSDYKKLMQEIEQMIRFVASRVKNNLRISWESPWEYITIEEAYRKFKIQITNAKLNSNNKIQKENKEDENFEKNYIQYIEPKLGTRGKPTFITDFPSWQSPLAKSHNSMAERFELYINGVELINGWTELTNWRIQKENLEKEQKERAREGKTKLKMDYGFIEALKKGMPECAGAAMGVDRLIMLLGGYKNLSEVILFPTSKLFSRGQTS